MPPNRIVPGADIQTGINYFYYKKKLKKKVLIDKLKKIDAANQLVVCWNKSNQLIFYAIGKLSKELEPKLEYVMPFSSSISLIETTKCNTLIALALRNNNVVVFDVNAGNFNLDAFLFI